MEIIGMCFVIYLILKFAMWICDDSSNPNTTPKTKLPPRILKGDILRKCCIRQEEYLIITIEPNGVWVIPWCIDGKQRSYPRPGTGEIYISNEDIEKHYIHQYGKV